MTEVQKRRVTFSILYYLLGSSGIYCRRFQFDPPDCRWMAVSYCCLSIVISDAYLLANRRWRKYEWLASRSSKMNRLTEDNMEGFELKTRRSNGFSDSAIILQLCRHHPIFIEEPAGKWRCSLLYTAVILKMQGAGEIARHSTHHYCG